MLTISVGAGAGEVVHGGLSVADYMERIGDFGALECKTDQGDVRFFVFDMQNIISPMGDISIDVVGFKGLDCEKATQFLEALGAVGKKIKKPEYHQRSKAQQRIGG